MPEKSNLGQYDLAALPDKFDERGLVIKFIFNNELEDLISDADNGAKQIKDSGYIAELKQKGYENVIGYGISFFENYCIISKLEDEK